MARILLIDEDPLSRAMMRRTLRRAGHESRDAQNGHIGLQMFSSEPADTVITDILMPDKDGIETIMELRRFNQPLKILAISGGNRMGPLDVLGFARRLGADDVLRKPFRTRELLDRVSRLLAAKVSNQGPT